jgi:RimJ/RimL family protein N-acetyltransferase
MITEDNFLDFACPHCKGTVSFPTDLSGSVQECPSCGQTLIVPGDERSEGNRLPLPIDLPQVQLRRFGPADWKDLMECLADEEAHRFTGRRPMEEEEVLRWLDSDGHVKLTTVGQPIYLGIELKENAKLIGYIQLDLDAQREQATVEALVNRQYQNKGLATQALEGALVFCFDSVKVHRVSAACDSRNTAALKLFEAVGLRKEGEFVKNRFLNGEWSNTVHYAVLEEEWNRAS